MKSSGFIDRDKLIRMLTDDIGYKLLLFCCVCGIFFGSLSAAGQRGGDLDVIAGNFLSMRETSGFFAVLIKSFLSSFAFVVMAFLLGNFNFGCFIICVIPFFKGYGIGTALGYLFRMYGAKGLAYSALVIIPAAVISAIAVISASYSSAKLSNSLLKKTLGKGVGRQRYKLDFKECCRKYLTYLLLCFISSAAEALLNLLFSGFFDLK